MVYNIRHKIRQLLNVPTQLRDIDNELASSKMLIGKLHAERVKNIKEFYPIHAAEFKVFSQFGDDGIIQHLLTRLQIERERQVFVEFGVEDYSEANTRFLLENNNWRGLVMDGSRDNVKKIRRADYYWRHDLTAKAVFITRENINDVIEQAGFSGELGILHIDIDGNDYWVWQALEVVNPIIVIVEYNSVFGDRAAVTVPYDQKFERTKKHYSNLYWGASLKALWVLGQKKGYELVGSNSAGNNAYFVRRDKLGDFRPLKAEEAYVESRFRESRDADGRLTFFTGHERLKAIENLPVYDVEAGKKILLKGVTQ